MVFFKKKRRIARLEEQLAAAEAEKQELQQRLATESERAERLQAEHQVQQQRVSLLESILSNLNTFGDSLGMQQGTLAFMAETLRDEKQVAIESATQSATAQRQSSGMVTSLHGMENAMSETVTHIG